MLKSNLKNVLSCVVVVTIFSGAAMASPFQLNCLDPYFNAKRELEPQVQPANELITKSNDLESKKRTKAGKFAMAGTMLLSVAGGVGVAMLNRNTVDSRGVTKPTSTGYQIGTGILSAGVFGGISIPIASEFAHESSKFDVTLDGEVEARKLVQHYDDLSNSFRLLQAVERISNSDSMPPSAYDRELEVVKTALKYSQCGKYFKHDFCVLKFDVSKKVGEFIQNIVVADQSMRMCVNNQFFTYEQLSKLGYGI